MFRIIRVQGNTPDRLHIVLPYRAASAVALVDSDQIWVGWPTVGKEEGDGKAFLCRIAPKPPPPDQTLVILHSLAVCVEQLCARCADAPFLKALRPQYCVFCGQSARNAEGVLQLVGHGMYSRQVRGLVETGWIVIWIRRFLCLACGHTMSLLPDWLHPWRWYAGPVIVEALFRHCILREPAGSIGARFGRPEGTAEWRSLRRWRKQLLTSPTLWGWLGPRLGAAKPAADRNEGRTYLERLLAEGGHVVRSGIQAIEELSGPVRRTLRDLVHNRKTAWPLKHFLPGVLSAGLPDRLCRSLPTEEDSGPGPP